MNAIEVIPPLTPATRRQTRCRVCGFGEIRTDEVEDRGVIFLAECPHCAHRWTSFQPIAAGATPPAPLALARFERVPARVAREDRTAA